MFQSPFLLHKNNITQTDIEYFFKICISFFLNVAAQFSLYNIACAIPNVYNQIF